MNSDLKRLSKVPAVTLDCLIIKILAATLGETGGENVSQVGSARLGPRMSPAHNELFAREFTNEA
jgi:uncharacterized membrane-anchored protein